MDKGFIITRVLRERGNHNGLGEAGGRGRRVSMSLPGLEDVKVTRVAHTPGYPGRLKGRSMNEHATGI